MHNEIRIGLVGFGQMGRIHAYAYRSIPLYYDGQPCKIRLRGVCNTNEALAKKGVEQAGFEFATSDYRELTSNKDIDVKETNENCAIRR